MTDATLPGSKDGGYRLTGRHVLIWLLSFFGVVFAVNFTMMHYALSTFSGMEDDSPYKNGLAYNTDIDAGRRQNERGWAVEALQRRDADGGLRFTVQAADAGRAPISGLEGSLRLERPADRRFDHAMPLAASGSGRYETTFGVVEPGQWDLVIELSRGGEKMFVSRNRLILK